MSPPSLSLRAGNQPVERCEQLLGPARASEQVGDQDLWILVLLLARAWSILAL
jgi:hypothetical protein